MRKKVLGVAAVLLSVGLLATGCAVSGSDGGKDTLTLTWVSGTESQVIDPTVKAFEKANPGVTVKTNIIASTDLTQTLQTQLTAGTAPDIFLTAPPGSQGAVPDLAKAGYLAPLDDLPWAGAATAPAKAAMTYDGKVYGITPNFTSIGAIYNTDSLSAAGLTAPRTWSELLSFCAAAKAKGKVAFGLGLQEGWTTFLIPRALLATLIPDPDKWNSELSDGTFDYADSPQWKEALEKQDEMTKAGCFNDSPNGTSIDNTVLPGVINGDYLGTVSVSAHIGVMESKATGTLHLVTTPLPATDDAAAQKFEILPGSGLSINAASKNLALAKKFLTLWSSEKSLDSIAAASGTIPSIASDSFAPPASLKELAAAAADGHTIAGNFLWKSSVQQALTDGVQGIFAGSSTPQKTLDAMQAAYTAK
ncbi:carbohydrate ABC transporter substrate-binding protein [Leifsonia sp. ZF2019]|uniref:ABC transporter substrate-binding protein n=1 Tax=Leifsonia sp. ZF2019 TaxID=2781978 RepID=UPI001CBE6231|nr:ABC transporter substrate-binding protein [Leifsonia sp. ZF2019]UAJ79510.1 carbohydrate ABC transporter substrate-binding protein [Leifsonia sp. ZF2019]